MAQPRNFICGQCLSAVVGVTVRVIIPKPWIAAPVGMSLALFFMMLTATTHPPGGCYGTAQHMRHSSMLDHSSRGFDCRAGLGLAGLPYLGTMPWVCFWHEGHWGSVQLGDEGLIVCKRSRWCNGSHCKLHDRVAAVARLLLPHHCGAWHRGHAVDRWAVCVRVLETMLPCIQP